MLKNLRTIDGVDSRQPQRIERRNQANDDPDKLQLRSTCSASKSLHAQQHAEFVASSIVALPIRGRNHAAACHIMVIDVTVRSSLNHAILRSGSDRRPSIQTSGCPAAALCPEALCTRSGR
jgi:hypothetical protein